MGKSMIMDCQNAKWIWHPHKGAQEGQNQYVEFRREVNLDGSLRDCIAAIAADSHYELWINDVLIDWNQYQTWPPHKAYNTHNIDSLLKQGQNSIAIRALYRGENFAIYAKGQAGLIFKMTIDGRMVLASDKSWQCRKSPTYKSGPISKMTMQARFNFEYNAQNEDGWQAAEYKISDNWCAAEELYGTTDGYWKSLAPRPVEMLKISPPKPVKVVSAGNFVRSSELATVALTVANEAKALRFDNPAIQKFIGKELFDNTDKPLLIEPSENQEGICLVFDLGGEESGYLHIEADTPTGTMFDIAHGEFLDYKTVRCEIDGRNFADRYICRQGRNRWQYSFNRIGCRYLQLHIPKVSSTIKLYNLTVMPSQYPFEHSGSFECSDFRFNKLWQIGARTLELCANEHYEDCPWREQALYGTDHRLQALYGYYTFGETKFTAACWDLLGGGLNDDGLLELVAPGRLPVNIPSFTYHWISAVWELLLYGGDTKPARQQFERICIILDKALQNLTSDGVIENLKGEKYWHLYEWTYALKGNLSDYAAIIDNNARAYDAMNNLLIIESLRNAAKIAEQIKDERGRKFKQAADAIATAFHNIFWDDRKKCYASFRRGNMVFHHSQFVQAYAVKERVVPLEKIVSDLLRRITNSVILYKAEMPSKMFVYDALLSCGNAYESYILYDFHGTFCEMIEMGATSLWEVIGGEERFQCAGSLCHGWTAVFNYFAGARILGVRPLVPGFKEFTVEPVLLGLSKAKGVIPTPYGPIEAAWDDNPVKKEFHLTLRHSKEIVPRITAPTGRTLKII
jgi:alpha-L-rhamnosidase